MTAYSRTAGDGFYGGVVELADSPGKHSVTFTTVQRSDKNMVRSHTSGVKTVMTAFTRLSAYRAVIESSA